MNFPAAILVFRLLVRDTFRQSLSSRLFWLLLGLSGLTILLCLSVRLEGVTATLPKGEIELKGRDKKPFTGTNRGEGYMKLLFGAVRVPMSRDGETAIRDLHTLLAKLAATIGTLLLLLWSSGFLPEFLERRSVSVLLAKPVPRWSLLAGKFLGVLIFVALQVTLFIGGTWLALGLATDVWHPVFLASIPLLVLLFAILFSFSTLLAVTTRSAVLTIFGTLVFWSVCAGVNQAHLTRLDSPGKETATESSSASPLVEVGYWILPKPGDCQVLLDEGLQRTPHSAKDARSRVVIPELSIFSSLLFCVVLLAVASYRFVTQDF
jgi:ABC-type transport system involved in multi-copper enzyme maturation permease subunit